MPELKGTFSQQIATFNTNTQKKLQAIRRGVSIKLFGAVIVGTPVDTGRAAGNWVYSEGKADLAPVEKFNKSKSLPSETEQAILNSTGDVPIFLSNNLPYIKRLEEGWSKQAPQGMVRLNVVRFNRLVQLAAAKSR